MSLVRSLPVVRCCFFVLLTCADLSAQVSGTLPGPRSSADSGTLSNGRARIAVGVIDFAVTSAMKARRIPGVSVAIVRGGRIEMVKAYGFSSLESRVPADTGTRFAIGSVTKQFVAALALLLQEDGLISVHDTLAKWYPSLTRAREITLLDLMNHVSGYHDYYPLDFIDRTMARPTTAEHVIATFGTMPLDFDPGSRWSYSNTGYAILGRVLERVAGKPLGTLLSERIFLPLGMFRTVFEPARSDQRATGYVSWALGDPEPALLEGAGWLGAAGGIWSTASDVARWDIALMKPGFLSPASREVMFGERRLRDGANTGYAAGLQIEQVGGRTIFQHRGAAAGFVASNTLVPVDTAALVVLETGDQDIAGSVPLWLVSPVRSSGGAAAQRTQPRPPAPTPSGHSALQTAVDLFGQLQHGHVDRSSLSAEYNAFLTPARVASAAKTLAPLGEITRTEVLSRWERGGMEASMVRLTCSARVVLALMYRSPDGTIQEYLLW